MDVGRRGGSIDAENNTVRERDRQMDRQMDGQKREADHEVHGNGWRRINEISLTGCGMIGQWGHFLGWRYEC